MIFEAIFLGASLNLALGADPYFPTFHVREVENWQNDPCGPMYFNGTYHLFNQYNPVRAVWGNMSWSHSVSKDLVFWKRLPVALKNDMPYDKNGVFTGSVTLLESGPVIAYTCVAEDQLQCLAYPSDLSDPELTNWTKSSKNPVIPSVPPGGAGNSFRDDTTAWKSADGSSYIMAMGASIKGNAAIVTYKVSEDFESFSYMNELWSSSSPSPIQDSMWECPDFFASELQGFHVAKVSAVGRDWTAVGIYDETSNTFSPVSEPRRCDLHQGFYASKSFYDSVGDRHILWGWIRESDNSGESRGWQGMNSLPRVMTVHPTLKIVEYNPLPELSNLRGSPLIQKSKEIIQPNSEMVLTGIDSVTFEVVATFEVGHVTSTPASFGLRVLRSSSQHTDILISFQPAIPAQNNTDRPGGDYRDYGLPASNGAAANIKNCSSQCDLEDACLAWTYVREGGPSTSESYPVPRCSLKSSVPSTNPNNWCVSGVKGSVQLEHDTTNSGGDGNHNIESISIPLTTTEKSNSTYIFPLHLFVDHSIIESFALNGRAAGTSRVYSSPTSTSASVINNSPNTTIQLTSLIAYPVQTIWNQ